MHPGVFSHLNHHHPASWQDAASWNGAAMLRARELNTRPTPYSYPSLAYERPLGIPFFSRCLICAFWLSSLARHCLLALS